MLVVGLVVTKCIQHTGVEFCILVGHFKRTTGDEECFLLLVAGLSFGDRRVAIVDDVQVVSHRGEHGFFAASQLLDEDDGSAQQEGQCDKA